MSPELNSSTMSSPRRHYRSRAAKIRFYEKRRAPHQTQPRPPRVQRSCTLRPCTAHPFRKGSGRKGFLLLIPCLPLGLQLLVGTQGHPSAQNAAAPVRARPSPPTDQMILGLQSRLLYGSTATVFPAADSILHAPRVRAAEEVNHGEAGYWRHGIRRATPSA